MENKNNMNEIECVINFLESKIKHLNNNLLKLAYKENGDWDLSKVKHTEEYKELKDQINRWNNKKLELENELEKVINEKFNLTN